MLEKNITEHLYCSRACISVTADFMKMRITLVFLGIFVFAWKKWMPALCHCMRYKLFLSYLSHSLCKRGVSALYTCCLFFYVFMYVTNKCLSSFPYFIFLGGNDNTENTGSIRTWRFIEMCDFISTLLMCWFSLLSVLKNSCSSWYFSDLFPDYFWWKKSLNSIYLK